MAQNIMQQIDGVTTRMTNRAKNARRAGNRRIEKGALAIQELAQTLAPIDESNLEDAIEYTKLRTGTLNTFDVSVNTGMPGSHGANNVGQYALRMHEDPNYQLGPKSADKDLALGGNGFGYNYGGKVGAKFLERAFEKLAPKIEKDVREAIRQGLK